MLPFLKGQESGASGILAIFTIEHIMIGIVVCLRLFLDKDPAWVKLFKQRKAYKKEQKSLKEQEKTKRALMQAKFTGHLLKTKSTISQN